MLCYFYCPDASIVVENGKAVGVDLDALQGLRHLRQGVPRQTPSS